MTESNPLPSRAQGALEYLLLVGGAVLVSTIILLIILTTSGATNTIINSNLSTYQDALADAYDTSLGNGPAVFNPDTDAQDIHYGPETNQVLDWYSPAASGPGPWPVIVWVHGGGFYGGTEDLTITGEPWSEFLAAGYSVVSVRYTFAPPAFYPAQTIEVGRAIQFLRANALQFNINPDKIIGFGRSAGADHLGYLSFGPDLIDSGSLDSVLHESSRPNALINFQGTTDFTSVDGLLTMGAIYFCGSDTYAAAQQCADDPLLQFSMMHQISLHNTSSPVPVFSYYTGTTSSPPGPPYNDIHDRVFGLLLQEAITSEYGIASTDVRNTYYPSLTNYTEQVRVLTIAWMADPAVGMNPN